MSNRPVAVVCGGLAQRPSVGGHAWVFLNWVRGLQALGYQVLFLDRLDRLDHLDSGLPGRGGHADTGHPGDDHPGTRRRPVTTDPRCWLSAVMARAGGDTRHAILVDNGPVVLGSTRREVIETCRQADVLLNFMGFVRDEEVLDAARGRRVFVDLDPGFPQMWQALGLCDLLQDHDAFVTVGLGVGTCSSGVPTCGRRWVPTLPPVDVRAWTVPPHRPAGGPFRFTSVASWRGPEGPVEYGGTTYGLRVHEHRAFTGLPGMVEGAAFELALAIDPADGADARSLAGGGWALVDPARAAGDPGAYRRYVRGSDGEFQTAKNMYVRSRGGWFSDRSACYLAAGRPVVAQDTGWTDHLPVGSGLLAFGDPDQAAEAVGDVLRSPVEHGQAARQLAEDLLDAPLVVSSVLRRVGLG